MNSFLQNTLLSLATFFLIGSASQAQQAESKTTVPTFSPPACSRIADAVAKGKFLKRKGEKITTYYTAVFPPGPDGKLRDSERDSCLKIEGSCIVGKLLYNVSSTATPNVYDRDTVGFKFGQGNGTGPFNKTNALFPCRTLAADPDIYPSGTVIYIPATVGRHCPQNNQLMDGCFVVGDVGSAIKGPGRFDMFTGECADYVQSGHYCRDNGNAALEFPNGAPFYRIERKLDLAGALRDALDDFVEAGWK
jgi:3D (Asp-Asp-Asp) domain-containing protein